MCCIKKKISCLIIITLLFLTNFSIISARTFDNVSSDDEDDCDCPDPEITSAKTLQPGDIMFKTVYTCLIYVHTLIFKQYHEDIDKYEFIEAAIDGGVKSDLYDLDEITNSSKYKFARVTTASDAQKQNAILFAESQIGKHFQWDFLYKNFDPDDPDDEYSDQWYCSELIWAAYYNCNYHPDDNVYGRGIDIDCNGGIFVKPRDIRNDLKVRVFYLKSDKSIQLEHSQIFLKNIFSNFLLIMYNVLRLSDNYDLMSDYCAIKYI